MLFEPQTPAPGHDPGFPELSNFLGSPAEPGVCQNEMKEGIPRASAPGDP